jgi:LPS export ABC transporter protein LptC
MRKLTGFLFGAFLVLLVLQIVIGFPISLEQEPILLPKKIVPKTAEEIQKEELEKARLEKERKFPISNVDTAQKMDGVHLVESRKGTRDWELYADSAENQNKNGQWNLQVVKIFFYNKDKIDFIVTGQSGYIEPGSRNIRIQGDVVTKSANGYVFRTSSVSYNSEKRLITSPDLVRMRSPSEDQGSSIELTGQNMEAQVESNKIFIHKNVKGQKLLSNGRAFFVESGAVELSGNDRSARFFNNVNMQLDSTKIQGPEAQFNYRSGIDLLDSIRVVGGAKVSDREKYATSDSVQYDPEKNDFIFFGRPRVVQNNDEITGEKIIFVDGGKRVKVEKIKATMEKPMEKSGEKK